MDWGMAKLHPVVLLWALGAWFFGMFFYAQSLYCLLFLGANLLWYLWRLGKRGLASLKWYLLPAGVTVLFNLFFYPRGHHILFYFLGRPILKEGLVYGLYMGALLLSLLLFWQVFLRVFPRGKWLWLWRRVLPQTAMVFLFSGGLFARCKKNMAEKWQVLTAANGAPQSLSQRRKDVGDNLYAFAGWSIQWGMETVDSVNSRGYNIGGGSSAETYSFGKRDVVSFLYWLVIGLIPWLSGGQAPLDGNLIFILAMLGFFGYWEGKEGRIWRRYTM